MRDGWWVRQWAGRESFEYSEEGLGAGVFSTTHTHTHTHTHTPESVIFFPNTRRCKVFVYVSGTFMRLFLEGARLLRTMGDSGRRGGGVMGMMGPRQGRGREEAAGQ